MRSTHQAIAIAIGKGVAIGFAALVGLALCVGSPVRANIQIVDVRPLNPRGLLIGAATPRAFSAVAFAAALIWSCNAGFSSNSFCTQS